MAPSIDGEAEISLDAPEGRLTDEFLRDLAEVYLNLAAAGRHPAPPIAEHVNRPVRTVHRWIALARKRGHLPPATQGRVG